MIICLFKTDTFISIFKDQQGLKITFWFLTAARMQELVAFNALVMLRSCQSVPVLRDLCFIFLQNFIQGSNPAPIIIMNYFFWINLLTIYFLDIILSTIIFV